MKKFKILSLILVPILLLGCVVFPNAPEAKAIEQSTARSDGYVTALPADFEYYSQNSRIYLTGYKGTYPKVIVPETIDGLPVFSIKSETFSTSDLTHLKLPSTLYLFGTKALSNCDSLVQIDIAEGNTKFCSVDGVLYSKDKLKLIAFPAGRTGKFTVPDGVTSIANFAFYRCYQIENVNMYNTVTSIGERAFSFCWNLKKLRLSDNLQTVGPFAFSHCNDLTSLHLPQSLTSIGYDALLGRINSNDSSKDYYLVDGIYCTKGSYAARYVSSLKLNYIDEGKTLTDVPVGITVTDTGKTLPDNATLKIDVKQLNSIPEDFSGIKHSKAYVFDVYLSVDGKLSVPKGSYKINFDDIADNLIPTATKVFTYRAGSVEPILFSLTQNSTDCYTDSLGTFIVLTSDDFSLKGDVDGDGLVSVLDARLALIASVGLVELTNGQKSAADVIATGSDRNVITTADARKILRTAAGIKN